MMTDAISDVGLIGLAVMGQNLVLNMADHGYHVSVYNRTTARTTAFLDAVRREEPSGERVHGVETLEELVASIRRPRKVILLVKAGAPTDVVLEALVPLLEPGDVVVDGGNAHWLDSIRREKELSAQGLLFVGSGVSGGELGARFGPSLMPGGTREGWESIRSIWEAIAAKVDPQTGRQFEDHAPGKPVTGGVPCATHIGPNGAGHFVKMVHNGIEYIDMQLIGEAYFLMKGLLGMHPGEIASVFQRWSRGVLDSYLVEITAEILAQPDPREPNRLLVDQVLDVAGQKGTGAWTSVSAIELGVPANAMAEAVFARFLSARKDERVAASEVLEGPVPRFEGDGEELIGQIEEALYCSKICAYAQGFSVMATAQSEFDWRLDFGAIARVWRGGCIIRARLLQEISNAFETEAELPNLMLDPYFRGALHGGQDGWRNVVAVAARNGISVPAFMSALAYFDGYRSAVLPANLIQAQRDYFGAHLYERTDEERGRLFHVDWSAEDRPEEDASR
jgi:6-phosphogluconate dehydrogenase